jgi:hypothetical protein
LRIDSRPQLIIPPVLPEALPRLPVDDEGGAVGEGGEYVDHAGDEVPVDQRGEGHLGGAGES